MIDGVIIVPLLLSPPLQERYIDVDGFSMISPFPPGRNPYCLKVVDCSRDQMVIFRPLLPESVRGQLYLSRPLMH